MPKMNKRPESERDMNEREKQTGAHTTNLRRIYFI